MKAKRTQTAIAAFYHAAGLKEDPNFPSWVMDAALGGKKKSAAELISVLDLFGNDSHAPINQKSEKKDLKTPFDAYPADEIHLENLLLWGKENLDHLPSADACVSRYEAGRLAAALACIQPDTVTGTSAPPMTLLAGDLSGVQDFIYTITNKGAVSALRGRSLYLQLLTEAIARYTLAQLDLPISNLLYMGGGQFHILADKTDKLTEVRKEISNILLRHHKGTLSLTLANTSLTVADLLNSEKLTATRKALNEDLQARKKRRFSELGDDLAKLFEPQGHGGNEEGQCSICGQEDDEVEAIKDDEGNETGSYICPDCASHQELGKDLRKARYLVWRESALSEKDRGYKKTLHRFGWDVQFYDEGKLPENNGKKETVLAINEAALQNLTPNKTRATGRRYLVNVTPLMSQEEADSYQPEAGERKPEAGDIKPFKMLAEEAEGINRLGILRMDVDNLGKLFESGLGTEASLARLNALSGQISKFFEGEVERIAKEVDAARLYSIYSGGDDLFFVGAWDAVVALAVKIRAEMDIFSGSNPKFRASAGIVLISNKYPLAQGAQAAGKAEHQSKLLAGKNAITFLGETFSWERFSARENSVLATQKTLDELIKSGEARAPVYQLLRLYAQYEESLQKGREKEGDATDKSGKPQIQWGRWMWLGYYSLKRNRSPKIRELGDQLKEKGDFGAMDKLGVAARWAMLLNRKKQAKEEASL